VEVDILVKAMQAAIAPCLLISGFGFLLLTMTNRLGRSIDRIRILNKDVKIADETDTENICQQIRVLYQRSRLLRTSIALITLSIFLIGVIVFLLFSNFLFNINLSYLIALLFSLSILSLIASMSVFFLDIRLTLKSIKIEIDSSQRRK